ncbi:hypothetical protein WJX84_012270 [Apatococcus fuscideae]|uniref:Uncharacterized protein n=1 Tax=Apatococcus fuscideae TaxID=2026836 RepID=A0AAW1SQ66_9CHLO
MAEAIKTSLPFVVDELFSVSTIDVVRSVSADKLKSALQWLVEGVQKLQGDQTVLRQDLAELFPQVAAFSKGPFVAHLDTQVPAEQKPPNSLLRAKSSLQKTAQDLGPLVGELADLQQRIQILEAASTAGPAEAATNGPQQDAQQQAQMDPSLQTDQQRDPQNADRIKALEEEVTRLSAALEGLTSRGSGAQSAIKVSDDFHADDASKPEALTETLQVSAQAFRPQAQAQPTSRSHASSYLPEDAAPERRPSAARSQPGDAGSGDKSQSDAWLEDQFGQLRAMLAGKADAQGLMALQAIVARKAESDDLHRLQASMPYPAGHAAAAELATVRVTDKLDAGQRLIVERALLPQQQAVWIQRPKTGASGGANSGDGQESVTVEQLAASLQTVAAVTHAMALGPPTQATSASSLAQRRQGSISKGLLEAPPALESLPLVDITAALGNALDAGCIQEKQDRPFGRRKANEAVTNRPAANANGAPSKETDKQIRALRTELALLKKRLEEMPMQLILPPADGDFAILASRPIMGYKCMACDRPLAHLEDKSGPAVSSNFLPARPGVDARRMGNAKVEEGRGRSGPTRADSPEREHAASVGGTPDDARSVHGLPMEKHAVAGKSVPGQELGPQLPKGGWRSKSPYEEHQHPHPRTSPASLGSTAT